VIEKQELAPNNLIGGLFLFQLKGGKRNRFGQKISNSQNKDKQSRKMNVMKVPFLLHRNSINQILLKVLSSCKKKNTNKVLPLRSTSVL
jgi:ribosomal protein L28